MTIQRKKHTKGAVGERRSHHALKKINLNKCPKCGKAVEPHKACLFCGNYKGREVIKIKTKKAKKKIE